MFVCGCLCRVKMLQHVVFDPETQSPPVQTPSAEGRKIYMKTAGVCFYAHVQHVVVLVFMILYEGTSSVPFNRTFGNVLRTPTRKNKFFCSFLL